MDDPSVTAITKIRKYCTLSYIVYPNKLKRNQQKSLEQKMDKFFDTNGCLKKYKNFFYNLQFHAIFITITMFFLFD